MALAYRTFCKNGYYLQTITKPVKWSVGKKCPIRIMASNISYQNAIYPGYKPVLATKDLKVLSQDIRRCSTQGNTPPDKPPQEPEGKKQGLVRKFKEMYRDYWYVLLPVHVCTSIVWFGSFYYTVRSGVDVFNFLQALGISESLLAPLRDSTAGYFALTLALYKLSTPLRYAVTIGGTTYAIKKLTAIGLIKPVPTKARIKEIFQEKRDNIQNSFNESKNHYKVQMKEKGSQVVEEMKRYKTEMRNMKKKVKKM